MANDIACAYTDIPAGYGERSATYAQLQAAGFYGDEDVGTDRPGEQPLGEMLVEGGAQTLGPDVAAQLMRHAAFRALHDRRGNIVAVWDEGRWWTPEESDEFTRRLVDEMTGDTSSP